MMQRKRAVLAMAVATVMAGGSFCAAQARQPGAGAAGGGAASPAAAPGGAAAASGQQVDQQLMQQYQQISQQPQTAADKLFVLEAALHNMHEVAVSTQAVQKAQSPEVKQIAQRMVQDHTQAIQQFQQAAQGLQLQLPQGLPSLKQQELQAMGSLPAEQFDKKYISHLHMAHARDVAAFQSAVQITQNPQAKQLATQMLPILQEHQQHVMRTAQAMGVVGQAGEAQPAGGRLPGSGTGAPGSGTGGSGTGSGTGGSGSGSGGTGSGGTGTGGSSGGGTGGSSGGGTGGGTGTGGSR